MLNEKVAIICDDKKCVEMLSTHFANLVNELDINRNLHTINTANDMNDHVESAIKKNSSHPSIIRIKNQIEIGYTSMFQQISNQLMEAEIFKLNSSKATPLNSIPVNILKLNALTCSDALTSIYNNLVRNGQFSEKLKSADITPIFKRDDRLDKSNYRPISILSAVCKVFEKLMYTELYMNFNTILSKYICGFRKGFSSQH